MNEYNQFPNQWFDGIEVDSTPLTSQERDYLLEKVNRFLQDLHEFRCKHTDWFNMNFETYSPTQLEYDALSSFEDYKKKCKDILNKPQRTVGNMKDRFQILAGIK